MSGRALCVAGLLGIAACSATPASLGITGPGTSGPSTFKPVPASDDAAVPLPGLPASGNPYSNSLRPAGDSAAPGSFYGYN